MSYYFLAQISINDPEEYQNYLDKADSVFNKYNGKYLAVDYSPIILEGNWNYSRIILIEFETKDDFNDWHYSPDYQNILKHRLKASDCDSLLIKSK